MSRFFMNWAGAGECQNRLKNPKKAKKNNGLKFFFIEKRKSWHGICIREGVKQKRLLRRTPRAEKIKKR